MKKLELRDYQKQIISELGHLASSALFMGTGTGKTFTSLQLMKKFKVNNILVVSPHNALKQWKNNIKEHCPEYTVIETKSSWTSARINQELNEIDFENNKTAFVINYEMIFRLASLPRFVNDNWVIILDEMHRIRNYGTQKNPNKIVDYILKLSEKTPFKLGLTATPTQGKFGGYIEYYPQLKYLGYTDLTYEQFYNRYVISSKKSIPGLPFPIEVIDGYRKVDEIESLLKGIARSYIPAYGELEPQMIDVTFEKPKTYNRMIRESSYKDLALSNQMRKRIAKKTLTTGTVTGRTVLGEKKSYVDNTAKLDWLSDFLKDVDSKVVVMYQYNVELEALKKLAEKIGVKYDFINGSVKDKNAVVNKDWKVLFGQYQAMSEALDGLQYVTNKMVLFSLPESSLHYKQVIGRIDRLGQTKVPIYYTLIMEGTIDEAIKESIDNKLEFSEETLNKLEI